MILEENLLSLLIVILSFFAFIAVLYSAMMQRQMLQRDYERFIGDRRFVSHYDDDRLELERRIADLSRELVYSRNRFNEINHLVVDGQKPQIGAGKTAIDVDALLRSIGITENQLRVDPKLIFVLSPFRSEYTSTYSAIVEAFGPSGVRVIRGDEQRSSGDILSHIIRQMLAARLVIANLDGRNPNVMYELGIAHALGKDVIIISQSSENIPFDVSSRRILFFNSEMDLVEKLRSELVLANFQ